MFSSDLIHGCPQCNEMPFLCNLCFSVFLYIIIQKEEKEEKDKKRPGSRGSAKSKVSGKEADQEPTGDKEPVPDEKYWPVCVISVHSRSKTSEIE